MNPATSHQVSGGPPPCPQAYRALGYTVDLPPEGFEGAPLVRRLVFVHHLEVSLLCRLAGERSGLLPATHSLRPLSSVRWQDDTTLVFEPRQQNAGVMQVRGQRGGCMSVACLSRACIVPVLLSTAAATNPHPTTIHPGHLPQATPHPRRRSPTGCQWSGRSSGAPDTDLARSGSRRQLRRVRSVRSSSWPRGHAAARTRRSLTR